MFNFDRNTLDSDDAWKNAKAPFYISLSEVLFRLQPLAAIQKLKVPAADIRPVVRRDLV